MNTTIYLVRHAQAAGNLLKEFNGITDGVVTDIGYLQLAELSKKTKDLNIDVIYSSPLKRAYLTAQAINKNYNLNVIVEDHLTEINCGDWEDELWDVIKNKFADNYDIWVNLPHKYVAPNGDSMEFVYNRINKAIAKIVSENKGRTIAIASHSAAIRCYLAYILGHNLEGVLLVGWGDNTNISKIVYDDNLIPTLEYKYDNSHLSEEISTFAMRKKLDSNDYIVK